MRWKCSQDVIVQDYEDEVVLVNVVTNQIYTLNSTAAALWKFLAEGLDTVEIEEKLATEYDVDREELRQNIQAALTQLSDDRLIEANAPR